MAYRWHPKNAEVDPNSPRAWGACDRCGFVWQLSALDWQWDFQGTPQLQNTRLLVCDRCKDKPQPQLSPPIILPDPRPAFNARPEPYAIDESSWIATQDYDPIATQSDDPMIVQSSGDGVEAANTTNIFCAISDPGGSVATLYLDLFDGDPSSGGRSVLAAITGSSVRTDIAGDLTTTSGVATNTSPIAVSSASESQTNINWVGLYSASISGTLLMSGTCSVSQTIAEGNPVQFDSLGLRISLT